MNAKKELQVWVDNTLGYKIEGSKLLRHGSEWVESGSVACEFTDSGECITIHFEEKEINLDYYEVAELLALLLHNNDMKIEFVKAKVIRTI